jgi:serine/threonine-protein kinase HipA
MTKLVVDLYGRRVGTLDGERDRFDFTASKEAIVEFGASSPILSISTPLLQKPRAQDQDLRRNFFEEILAEGSIRQQLGANVRLDADNTLGLLTKYGRDVAGAVQVWDPSDPDEPRTPETRLVTGVQVRTMFAEVKVKPLGNNGRRRLSSLAGLQDKVLLVRTAEGWAEPLDGFPSTHILKPLAPRYASLIFDEEYASRFVRALGLASFSTAIESFDGVSALVIERYDRTESGRVHQEDFNQVLGYRGDQKYEPEIGGGRLRQIASVLREHASSKDVQALLRMTALSIAVGNLDMHAKNISILHLPDGEIRLAPMYDVVPQLHFDLTPETALRINGVNDYYAITISDLAEEGRSWGLQNAEKIVLETIEQVQDIARNEEQLPGAAFSLSESVQRTAGMLLDSHAHATSVVRAAPHGKNKAPVGKTLGDQNQSSATRKQEVFPPRTVEGGWGGPVR